MANAFIEKLARAMAKADGFNPDAGPNYVSKTVMTDVAFPPGTKLWERYIPTVRVILLAAREPSEEMIEIGANTLWHKSDHPDNECDGTVELVWQTMIDQALQD